LHPRLLIRPPSGDGPPDLGEPMLQRIAVDWKTLNRLSV
jgi:hypothetical protein